MLKLTLLGTLMMLIISCTLTYDDDDASERDSDPNYADGIYINNHIEHPDKSFFSFIKVRWFGDEPWADHEKAAALIPQTLYKQQRVLNKSEQVTWLGHSSFLIQTEGKNILTDPVFSERSSPFSFMGPKRYTPVAASLDNLPAIDIVIISHNHYDHLDVASIKALGNAPQYFVPSGLKSWFVELGIDGNKVKELRWWESVEWLGLSITATPSQHWSARGLGDRHESHWASWLVLSDAVTLWFAGDTGYNDKDFVAIGEHIQTLKRPLDLALIPIGAYAPRSFMQLYHVNPEEAVQIHKDIGAKRSIGMHWGAFPLTAEWPMEPYERLKAMNIEQFDTMQIGETRQLK